MCRVNIQRPGIEPVKNTDCVYYTLGKGQRAKGAANNNNSGYRVLWWVVKKKWGISCIYNKRNHKQKMFCEEGFWNNNQKVEWAMWKGSIYFGVFIVPFFFLVDL